MRALLHKICEKIFKIVKRVKLMKNNSLNLPAAISAFITGWIGIVLKINSILGGNETGAGLCLIASALAFGSITMLK